MDTLTTEGKAYQSAEESGKTPLEKAMIALCLMHKLDQKTCLRHGGKRDSSSSQRNNEKASKVQMLSDM